MSAVLNIPHNVGIFLRAGPDRLRDWVMHRQAELIFYCVAAIIVGAGIYGAVIGSWRAPLQAFYTSIKLPLVILLTTLGNGLLNGMLAPLLGLNVTFRQSLLIVLMTFAIASLILGALSPVALFMIWNTPPLSVATKPWSPEYGFLQLMLATFVACAGIAGNVHLVPLLTQWTQRVKVARKVLLAWLAGNLFLGSQICWVLRPFIWEPGEPVHFFCKQPFHESFYETVFEAARRLISP